MLLELVRAQAAAALGYPDPAAIEPGRAFRDLGFDSVTAVDMRNRLRAVTGRKLATTIVFDYPNATALADHLLAGLLGVEQTAVTVDRRDRHARRTGRDHRHELPLPGRRRLARGPVASRARRRRRHR